MIEPAKLVDSASPATHCNIATALTRMAGTVADQAAIVVTRSRDSDGTAHYASLSFAELESLSNRYAYGLAHYGFSRGMRTLVMVRPGIDFIALVFALFKIGAVPVMIDPGMGMKRMLECIRSIDLQGFIGIPLAQIMRVLRQGSFAKVERVVTVGRKMGWGGTTLDCIRRVADDSFTRGASFEAANTSSDEVAAILFTSGSTGPAKGVVYEHGMFEAQVRLIQSRYGIEPGEIDLPTFPLFALFSTAMGMTSVIPEMDPSKPAQVNPENIVRAIRDQGVTSTFGSPALWTRVATHCVGRGIKLDRLKRILIAGAPVPYPVIERLHKVLSPEADVHTPYGATESLPVCSISGREVLDSCRDKSRRGAGTCVGRPVQEIDLRIIRITDDPIDEWSDELCLPDGEIGEIVVRGPVVTKTYYGLKSATRLAKIRDGKQVWHRIGDVGYRDRDGRIWFCGRKAHRVVTADGTLFSIPCEAIFNEHPEASRSALVGIGPRGQQIPAIVIEPIAGSYPRGKRIDSFRSELLQLGQGSDLTKAIFHVLFYKSLPVDIRHNAKINREALSAWALGKVKI